MLWPIAPPVGGMDRRAVGDGGEELLSRERLGQRAGRAALPRDREVLFRFYLAGETKGRICARLGLSGTQFNLVIHRARLRFRALVERAGMKPGDHSAADNCETEHICLEEC